MGDVTFKPESNTTRCIMSMPTYQPKYPGVVGSPMKHMSCDYCDNREELQNITFSDAVGSVTVCYSCLVKSSSSIVHAIRQTLSRKST